VVDCALRELHRDLRTVRDVRKLTSELVHTLSVQQAEGAEVLRYAAFSARNAFGRPRAYMTVNAL
jgi:hypothetical protein